MNPGSSNPHSPDGVWVDLQGVYPRWESLRDDMGLTGAGRDASLALLLIDYWYNLRCKHSMQLVNLHSVCVACSAEDNN